MEQQPTSAPRPPSAGERTQIIERLGRAVHAQRAYLAAVARAEGLAPEDALDAAQEAFFVLIARPDAAALLEAGDSELRPLLTTVVRNHARNQRRLHARSRPHRSDDEVVDALPDSDASADALVAAAEERIRLIGCVRTLEKVQRAVVTLRMLDERPGEDVARELQIAPGHVAVLLHRAKKNLLACLTQVA